MGHLIKSHMIVSHKNIAFSKLVFNTFAFTVSGACIYQSQAKIKQFPLLLLPNKHQRFIALMIYVKAGSYLDVIKGNVDYHRLLGSCCSHRVVTDESWYSAAADIKRHYPMIGVIC